MCVRRGIKKTLQKSFKVPSSNAALNLPSVLNGENEKMNVGFFVFFRPKQSLDVVLKLAVAPLLRIKVHFASSPLFALVRHNDQTWLGLREQETKLCGLLIAAEVRGTPLALAEDVQQLTGQASRGGPTGMRGSENGVDPQTDRPARTF